MMGATMGTIRFAIHGDPDRYRTAIGNARTRSKIAKGLAIPVTMEPPHVQTLETMNPQPAPLSLPEPPPENSKNFPAIVPDPTPIQVGNLPSPALSTTASNELEITEAEIPTPTTPKTTPPRYNKEEHHQITDPKEYIPPQPPKTLNLTHTASKPTVTETRTKVPADKESTDKEIAHRKLPKPSARKALFETEPEADITQASKKPKNDP
ncbi:hypothetical protein Tco_1460273 [Tanacetum coccineum]